jgi:hypothetical protein
MIQFYGETLEHLRYVNHSEDEILEKNFFNPTDVGRLLELRTQKGQLEMALKTIAIELDEEHDFCIPGITGWRMWISIVSSQDASRLSHMKTAACFDRW